MTNAEIEATESNLNSTLNSSHENEHGSITPPNSPMSIDENEATEGNMNSSMNSSMNSNHETEPDAGISSNAADDVICLSDSANISRHRPMRFDMISGGYSYKNTVKINKEFLHTNAMQISIILFHRTNLIASIM